MSVVDPVTTAALATVMTGVANGATGEAGRQVWDSLVATVRRAFGRSSEPARAVQELEEPPAEDGSAREVATVLVDAAERDAEFSAELSEWMSQARLVIAGGDHSVSNKIGDHARVEGSVVQTRDVHGSINFGSTNT